MAEVLSYGRSACWPKKTDHALRMSSYRQLNPFGNALYASIKLSGAVQDRLASVECRVHQMEPFRWASVGFFVEEERQDRSN